MIEHVHIYRSKYSWEWSSNMQNKWSSWNWMPNNNIEGATHKLCNMALGGIVREHKLIPWQRTLVGQTQVLKQHLPSNWSFQMLLLLLTSPDLSPCSHPSPNRDSSSGFRWWFRKIISGFTFRYSYSIRGNPVGRDDDLEIRWDDVMKI